MKRIILTFLVIVLTICGCNSVGELSSQSNESNNEQKFFKETADNNDCHKEDDNSKQYESINKSNYDSIREFAISKEAADIAIKLSGESAYRAEICAYAGNIMTFKVFFSDNSHSFHTFKIEESSELFLVELNSKSSGDEKNTNGEYFPNAKDGYSEEMLTPYKYWDIFTNIVKLEYPQKVEYCNPTKGGDFTFLSQKEIEKICSAMDKIEVIKVERFFTEFELDMGFNLSNVLKYYESTDSLLPEYEIYHSTICVSAENYLSNFYYVNNYTEFWNEFKTVLLEIENERLINCFQP